VRFAYRFCDWQREDDDEYLNWRAICRHQETKHPEDLARARVPTREDRDERLPHLQ
jgi:hypothetical protein